MEISGSITTSNPLYDAETNSFVVSHGLSNVYAIPFSLTLKNTSGNFEEIVASKVEFTESGVIIYLGSLELSDGDEIFYRFNAVEVLSEDSDSSSLSETL